MRTSPRRCSLLILVAALALVSATVIRAQAPTADAPSFPEIGDHFKYGSIGTEEGVGLPYWIWRVLPTVFGFLTSITPAGVAMMTDITAYLDFVLVIFLAFGASFELPVALVILVALGWVTPAQLRESRGYAVVGIFIIAAVITPPDVVSQLLLAIPMCLLYEIGILATRWVTPCGDAESP